jgi:hypothetical protein
VLSLQHPRELLNSFHGTGRFGLPWANRPAWSPDGRTIAVSAIDQATASGEVIEVDLATGTEPAVRAIGVLAAAHEVAYLSPTRLVTSRVTVDESQQWWLHPATGPAMKLTPDLTDLVGVQLTGDRTAAVATRTDGRASITVGSIGPAGASSFVEAVAPSTTRPWFAQLDGRGRVFYAARVPGDLATFVSDSAGGTGVVVAPDLTYALPSPDGTFVVGRRNRDLVRVDVDGSGMTVLLPGSQLTVPVTITPDGESLLMVAMLSGQSQPWLLPLTGGEPRRLAEVFINGAFLYLSRDGTHTTFPSPRGTQLCRFPTFDECRTLPVRPGPLSADGRTVLAINPNDPRNLIAQPIDGSLPRPLTSFTDMTIVDFSLSPDGSRIAITRAERESDVVLIKGLQ